MLKMVVSTEQMDGLLTDKDLADRYKAQIQCRRCGKWTLTDIRSDENICNNTTKGIYCGANDFDVTSVTSKRSFNSATKRKVRGK
jgi:hypothetical protein